MPIEYLSQILFKTKAGVYGSTGNRKYIHLSGDEKQWKK